MAKCELCGEPMPAGEEMFKFHGYSGPCPVPVVLKSAEADWVSEGRLRELWKEAGGQTGDDGTIYVRPPYSQVLRNFVTAVVKIAKEPR